MFLDERDCELGYLVEGFAHGNREALGVACDHRSGLLQRGAKCLDPE